MRNRRACVVAIPDAYDPHILVDVLESFDDSPAAMQRSDGPVKLTPEAAAGYARAILKAVDACLGGH